jgi:hypothetical protein
MLAGFDETAACIGSLNLVIAVDTSTANLTGAMGKLVRVSGGPGKLTKDCEFVHSLIRSGRDG